MEHEPVRQYTSIVKLQLMIKEWRRAKLNPTHSYNMLRLWMGTDYVNYMDEKGRWKSDRFNYLRNQFNYRSIPDFLGDVRRTGSFVIVGADMDKPDFIASPNWYEWNEEDGPLQPYSLLYDQPSQRCSQRCSQHRDLNNRYLNSLPERNPDGSGAGAPTEGEIHEQEEVKRLKEGEVRDYFKWLMTQTDEQHQAIINDLLHAIRFPKVPKTKKGQKHKDYHRTEAEAAEFLPFLIADQLVPYFAGRDLFFAERYRANPASRCYWIGKFVKTYVNSFVLRAHQNWEQREKKIQQHAAVQRQKEERTHRPRSPFEWEDSKGNRFYADGSGLATMIPPEAPVREEDNTYFSTILHQWIKIPTPNP